MQLGALFNTGFAILNSYLFTFCLVHNSNNNNSNQDHHTIPPPPPVELPITSIRSIGLSNHIVDLIASFAHLLDHSPILRPIKWRDGDLDLAQLRVDAGPSPNQNNDGSDASFLFRSVTPVGFLSLDLHRLRADLTTTFADNDASLFYLNTTDPSLNSTLHTSLDHAIAAADTAWTASSLLFEPIQRDILERGDRLSEYLGSWQDAELKYGPHGWPNEKILPPHDHGHDQHSTSWRSFWKAGTRRIWATLWPGKSASTSGDSALSTDVRKDKWTQEEQENNNNDNNNNKRPPRISPQEWTRLHTYRKRKIIDAAYDHFLADTREEEEEAQDAPGCAIGTSGQFRPRLLRFIASIKSLQGNWSTVNSIVGGLLLGRVGLEGQGALVPTLMNTIGHVPNLRMDLDRALDGTQASIVANEVRERERRLERQQEEQRQRKRGGLLRAVSGILSNLFRRSRQDKDAPHLLQQCLVCLEQDNDQRYHHHHLFRDLVLWPEVRDQFDFRVAHARSWVSQSGAATRRVTARFHEMQRYATYLPRIFDEAHHLLDAYDRIEEARADLGRQLRHLDNNNFTSVEDDTRVLWVLPSALELKQSLDLVLWAMEEEHRRVMEDELGRYRTEFPRNTRQ